MIGPSSLVGLVRGDGAGDCGDGEEIDQGGEELHLDYLVLVVKS